jgi:hypothetical protein
LERDAAIQSGAQKISSLEKQKFQLIKDNDDITEQLHVAQYALETAEKKCKQFEKTTAECRSRYSTEYNKRKVK